MTSPFDFFDDVDLPRSLELGFFDFVWADDFLDVDWVVEDFPVVAVVSLLVVSLVEDFVVDLRLFDDCPGSGGGWVVVVDSGAVVEDDDVYWSVIRMLRWPSSESELPSLTTKLKSSTSTPDGAW